MNELITKEEINIEDMIHEIRGKQVMLDSDLAKLYKCSNGTKDINKAVKRNIERFPEDFYFRITEIEYLNCSRFQNGTLNKSGNKRGSNLKYLPYAFTEQGVAMLSSVLKTKVASNISINIMRAFVSMRKYISNNLIEQKYINNKVLELDENYKIVYNDIKNLQESFDKLEEKKLVNEIYFNGQIYDAYSKIVDILSTAQKELIIVDGYADKTTLDIIKNIKCNVILIVRNKSKLSKLDIEKYNKQYDNLRIIYNDNYHDRYFIIDRNIIYHCGTSINHAGSETFSINILEDIVVKESLINNIIKLL